MATQKLSAITASGSNLVSADTLVGVHSGTTDLLFSGTQVAAFVNASPTITGHETIEGVTATGATGTGNFVFDGSPTLVTPTIGVAAGTSLALGGATIGSNALAVTGTTLLTGAVTGTSSLTLGTQQSAQGSIVLANTAAGAFSTTLQSSNSASAAWTLTLPTTAGTNGYALTTNGSGVTSWTAVASGLTINTTTISGGATNAILYGDGSGVLQNAAGVTRTGVGQLTFTQAPAANTSSDGLILTDITAATSGNQQFSPRIRLSGQGWKTTSTAASQAVDWIIENQPVQGATNPTSNLVLSSQINGAGYNSMLSINSAGNIQPYGYLLPTATSPTIPNACFGFHSVSGNWVFAGSGQIGVAVYPSGGVINCVGAGQYSFSSSTNPLSGVDTYLTRGAAATLQLGAASAASPVAQTLQSQGSRVGTDTDKAGANLSIQSGVGTGASTPSSLIFNTWVAVGSGSTTQTKTATLTLTNGTVVCNGALWLDGTYNATPQVVSGYITVHDLTGTAYKVAVTA